MLGFMIIALAGLFWLAFRCYRHVSTTGGRTGTALPLALLTVLLLTAGLLAFPKSKTYQFTVPQKIDDGWETADAGSEGLDANLINRLFERIKQGAYHNIHSVLVVKNGKLVVEEYFPGRDSNGKYRVYNRDTRHEIHSVTKSVSSILIGIAADQHLIGGVEQEVSALLPEYADVFSDHKRDELRLKHVLSMTAGLSWDEWTQPYSDPRNDWTAMHHSKDFVRYVLSRPVSEPPGARFVYSGGLSFVLGEIVHRRSGMRTDEFAGRYLFGPLGITNYSWWKFPDGAVEGDSGLVMRPRDMAKLGYLFLNGGRWQGKQIVSEGWVADSTRNYADARQFPPWIRNEGYGYQWWIRSFHINGQVIPSYHAAGMGGQFIFVFPSLQMVAVFTGWNENGLGQLPFEMVQNYILPAAVSDLHSSPSPIGPGKENPAHK